MQPVGQSNQSNYSAPTAPSTNANAPVEKVSSLPIDIIEQRSGEAVIEWVHNPSQIHTAVFESGRWKTVDRNPEPKKEIPEGKK
jgi:hypothetical protein